MTMHAMFESSASAPRVAGELGRSWRILREWRRRSRTRQELRVLGERERQDLSFRREVHAEIRKWFWQP